MRILVAMEVCHVSRSGEQCLVEMATTKRARMFLCSFNAFLGSLFNLFLLLV